jgi:hypothetical protein
MGKYTYNKHGDVFENGRLVARSVSTGERGYISTKKSPYYAKKKKIHHRKHKRKSSSSCFGFRW